MDAKEEPKVESQLTKSLEGIDLNERREDSTPATASDNGEGASNPEDSSHPEYLAPSVTPGTVFADPSNFTIKHPLQNRWTMWYDNPKKKTSQDTWGSHLKKIVDFDTVEDFWRLYNNIVPASQLSHGSNYHLFKYGIEPKWEDPANTRGGQWVVTLPSKQRRDRLDQLWLFAILACIGEAFGDDEDEVCGCVVSIRKSQDRIALWTRTASKEDAAVNIGRQFKRSLELPDNSSLAYQFHSDNMRRSSSHTTTRYAV